MTVMTACRPILLSMSALVFLVIGQPSIALSESELPNTIASCHGEGFCAQCLTINLNAQEPMSYFKLFPSHESCNQIVRSQGKFLSQKDRPYQAYGRASLMKDPDQIHELATQQQGPSVSGVGVAGQVLSNMLRQDVYLQQSKDVGRQLGNLRNLISSLTSNVKKHVEQSNANMHHFNTQLKEMLDTNARELHQSIDSQNASLRSLEFADLPNPQPLRAGDPAFGAAGLMEESSLQEMRQAIPPQNRRVKGSDLLGALQRASNEHGSSRESLRAAVETERTKLDADVASGVIDKDFRQEAEMQLRTIDNLIAVGDDEGVALAAEAYEDMRSARYSAEGKADFKEERVVGPNFELTYQKVPRGAPQNPRSLAKVLSDFNLAIAKGKEYGKASVQASLRYEGPYKEPRQRMAKLGSDLIDNSELAFKSGHLADADLFLSVGTDLLDFAIGWNVFLSTGRSAYELLTGKDLLSGRVLSDFELVCRALDIATVGFASKFKKGYETVLKISQPIYNSQKYKNVLGAAERFAEKAALKGLPQKIGREEVMHIVERHLPGGMHLPDPVEFGGKHTVFSNPEEILDLMVEAVGHPNAKIIDQRDGTALWLWRRGELASDIGYDFRNPFVRIKDVAVRVREGTSEWVTAYPFHPDIRIIE